MISCPAANEIRCVKPSIATVSPSWTSSATASCIVVTLLTPAPPALSRPTSTSATTSSKSSSAACAWSSRNTSGGLTRTSASPQPSISRPLRNDACSIAAAWSWSANVIPIQKRPAAHVGDDRVARRDVAQAGQQHVADGLRVVHQPFLLDHVERRERGRARHRGPAVGRAVRAELPDHQVLARDHRAERQPARDALARQDDVGGHALLLDRPHRAAAPDAGLHLVADEQDPVRGRTARAGTGTSPRAAARSRPRRATTPRRSPRPRSARPSAGTGPPRCSRSPHRRSGRRSAASARSSCGTSPSTAVSVTDPIERPWNDW